MAKLTRKQKIEIYTKRKNGVLMTILSKEYNIRCDNINYLIRLIDKHGFNILRKNKNNYYSPKLKVEIINKVLVDGQSIKSTAIEYGLSSDGMLVNWINSYKKWICYSREKERKTPPTMNKQNKTNKNYEDMTPK